MGTASSSLTRSRLSLIASGLAAPMRQTGRAGLDLVYPPRCPVTDEPVTRHGAFAPAAWARTSMIAAPLCECCGMPFALTDPATPRCGACAAPERYAFNLTGRGRLGRVRSALAYDDEAAALVLSLKYADRQDHVPALARLMASAGAELLTVGCLIVPVPLHRRRLLARRFNQAAVLSRALSAASRLDHAPRVLRRTKATPKQKGMSAEARRRNVAGAFAVRTGARAGLEGRRVVLIDDVLTTGATLIGCARALRAAGAAEVDAVTLARVTRS